MLSILIPVYNYNAFSLVKELASQCDFIGISFEILCQDDGSNSVSNVENEKINSLENCFFISLDKNIGLSSNRNLLASKSKYQNLLFIDGDAVIFDKNYIQNYLDSIQNSDIIYGGRIHPLIAPSDQQKLRWKYGRLVEDKTESQRNKSPYKTLLFNNTLIKKECFDQIKFDSGLTKYGHEDTRFAYETSKTEFKIKHIDNPVEHGDIDESTIYISKVKNSLQNLLILDAKHKIDPNFVKILHLFYFLKKFKLNYFGSLFYSIFNGIIFKQLCSKNPSLQLLNLYKISYLCSLKINLLQ
jgi:glycosyltransferase involved in cell wall biosynthesis